MITTRPLQCPTSLQLRTALKGDLRVTREIGKEVIPSGAKVAIRMGHESDSSQELESLGVAAELKQEARDDDESSPVVGDVLSPSFSRSENLEALSSSFIGKKSSTLGRPQT